ncbi:DUF3034 family protein [Kordiimonas pumila]|uniref:DUF3034 family protein n=1 Tax=Kordiimonas pumila TaxID=2161677 RepID=A0ABV7D2B0_9PROT|nr:DUF3034 family protein [Kordiimonas pumila]
MRIITLVAFACILTTSVLRAQSTPEKLFDQGKLLATGGVSQIEGAGGAGLSTWALISGYGSERGVGVNVHHTFVKLDDFTFNSTGVAIGLYDRVEVSLARQWFDTDDAGARLGLGEDFTFSQDIVGLKVRLFGDALYTQDSWLPQVAVGVQYKNASKAPILTAVGAQRDDDFDFYLTATKAILSKSLIASGAVRFTRANQFGLLGFGGVGADSYKPQFEGSLVYMLQHNLVLGADYRTKPDNLAFAEEGDSKAVYLAWFPNKFFSVTVAAVDLGPIALQGRQQGMYVSLQTGF